MDLTFGLFQIVVMYKGVRPKHQFKIYYVRNEDRHFAANNFLYCDNIIL
jgi:hypothetical protein